MIDLRQNLLILLKKILNLIYRKLSTEDLEANELVQRFNNFYHKSGYKTWMNTYWLGIKSWKCPLDLWIYQEIIYDLKPDIIIECGTFKGGTTLFLANICELVGNGRILTIDIASYKARPEHKRIKYFTGTSTSDEIILKIHKEIKKNDSVMVILDSDHSKNHVLNELRIYSRMVTKGSYLIVEDTNLKDPRISIHLFLKNNRNFLIDKSKNKFFLTFNPNG